MIVYDSSNFFPGFFTPRTAHKASFNTESVTEIAEILSKTLRCIAHSYQKTILGIHDETGLRGGTLVACPLPEYLASEGRDIEEAIQQALEEAKWVESA